MRWVEVGESPVAFFAFGAMPSGVIAIGAAPTGVIAIGQLSRGVISIGQLSVGGFAFGQLGLGIVWAGGQLAVAATSGFAMLGLGLTGSWVPFRRPYSAAQHWYRRPWRWIGLAIVVAAVTLVSLGPVLDTLLADDGVFRQPPEPRILR